MTAATPTTMPAATQGPALDPLAGLRDWHLPDPVSWWPPAPGWWMLAVLALILIAALWRWWLVRRRRSAAARAARSELKRLRESAASGDDPRGFAASVSMLLRRLALERFARERVAGITGAAWLAFLDETGGGDGFTTGPGRVLADAPYRPHRSADQDGGVDVGALADLAERWIRAQQRPAE